MGGPGPGANFDNGMEKLFGDNPTFTAMLVTEMTGPQGNMSVKTKMYFDHENSRTEMNMADAQGAGLPPDAITQMKSMGMDKVVSITPADKKSLLIIYPNMRAYVDMAVPASSTTNDFKIQKTKDGDEVVDGHACTKYDVVVSNGAQSTKFIAWYATDENNFPIKIAMDQQGVTATISFTDLSFGKVDSSEFQAPSGYTRYDSMQDLMQSVMKNQPPAGAGGAPSPLAPPPTQ